MSTKFDVFLTHIDKADVIKADNAKFKKNMLGVKISKIKKQIPTIAKICHIIIKKLLFKSLVAKPLGKLSFLILQLER